MHDITRELLDAYLDDALDDRDTARIEQGLRDSELLRKQLHALLQERDRGEHSLGAIWRRQRLSCLTREQLGSYLLQTLEPDWHDYVEFHLHQVGCAFCQANLADLQDRQKEAAPQVQRRRQRFFESSAGLLRAAR
jgi:hypothetical protein